MNRSVLAMELNDAGAQGWVGSSRPGLERAFRAAARHSRRVRFMRFAVPGFVVLVIAGVSVASFFSPARLLPKLPAHGSLASIGISGSKITMQLPRLEGYTRDARPYHFTAQTAAQDLLKPDNVEMNQIHAKIEMGDKAMVEMSAASGLYHSKADQLVLRENIVVTSTSGYEGHLTEAVVDMHSGHIVSDKPVEVKLLNGLLNANHLEIEGEVIRFDGGVTLDMDGRSFNLSGERTGK
jgi:lipopolysaccharide export system protein LptC